MDIWVYIAIGIACVLISYLIADRFHRQGYPFWKTFIMGSIALFGIIVMLISSIDGPK